MDLTPPEELAERPYERLRRMLDRAGLSNREIAEHLEVAPETVSRWRSGQQEMRGRDLRAVVSLLADRGIAVTEEWVRTGVAAPARRGAKVEPPDVPAPRPGTKSAQATGRKRA